MADFLPLDSKNWIVHGNALRIDWLSVCPHTEKAVEIFADDLFHKPQDQAQIDFENEGGETYICGNPPYLGSKRQQPTHKSDLAYVFEHYTESWKSLDYVAGWFLKAAIYGQNTNTATAFVSTKSINEGQQVPIIWPLIWNFDQEIYFAQTPFQWNNLASNNAGVTVIIVGLRTKSKRAKTLFYQDKNKLPISRTVDNINPYLIAGTDTVVESFSASISGLPAFERGNSPTDGGYLLLDSIDLANLNMTAGQIEQFVRPYVGSRELIRGIQRYCIWIEDNAIFDAMQIQSIAQRINNVENFRLSSKKIATVKAAKWPHRFDEQKPLPKTPTICVPVTSSENREYLPVSLLPPGTAISNSSFGSSNTKLWVLSMVASKMNLIWIATVCSKMRTDYRFTNTVGWNAFPVPTLTEKNKLDLTRCAEDILLAREKHFPATIADLYKSDAMPENLRQAHKKNDETLERIYIGRRFNNDTERLEKLFELYTKMTSSTNGKETLESAS